MSHVYFTDRDLGKKFPDILSAAGIAVKLCEPRPEVLKRRPKAPGSIEMWLDRR